MDVNTTGEQGTVVYICVVIKVVNISHCLSCRLPMVTLRKQIRLVGPLAR